MGNRDQRALGGVVLAGAGRLGAVLPILVGAALRLARLGAQDLWYDEAATAWFARLPLPALMQAVAGDVHPPAWYLVEKAAVCFLGNNAFALRLPAALFSILALALIPRLARSISPTPTPPPRAGEGSRVGVIATWIMALSPFQLWYAQEARMYSLLLLAVIVAVLGLAENRMWLYGLAGAAMLYTHNIGAVYFAWIAAWAVFSNIPTLVGVNRSRSSSATLTTNIPTLVGVNRQSLDGVPGLANIPTLVGVNFGRFVVWTLAVGLLYLPWAIVALNQAGAVAGSFWVQRPTVGAIPLTLHELFWSTIPPSWMGVFCAFLSGLAVIAAVWAGVRARRWVLLYLAFAPLLAVWTLSQITPLLMTRIMIGCAPFLALLLALALVEHQRARWLALAAAPVVALVVGMYFLDPSTQKGDVGRFVEPVQARYLPGDAVLHTCIPSYILLSYYAPELDHYLWRQANDLSQSLSDQTKQAMGMRETTIEELLQTHARVWVYYSDSPVTAQAELDENERIRAAYGVAWDKGWAVTLEKTDLIESGVYLVEGQ
jgi:mannosyltransferase